MRTTGSRSNILLCKCAGKEPSDDGEVAAFIVGGDNDGVLFFGGHDGMMVNSKRA